MKPGLALVPLRGGSKSILKKNIKLFAGKPLCAWVLEAALKAKYIGKVVVSTDCEEIKKTVSMISSKIEIVHRPEHLATDEASTDDVMIDFCSKIFFENLITIQATSPLLTSTHIDKAYSIFEKSKLDSMLTAVRIKRFFWDDNYFPLNYDPNHRPRRQDFRGSLMENGAFYITRRDLLLKTGCRLGGKIGIYEMPECFASEIDEPDDWLNVETLLKNKQVI